MVLHSSDCVDLHNMDVVVYQQRVVVVVSDGDGVREQ
jgi:hypothetical protein